MLYFLKKKLENRRSVGCSAPKPSLASGGWGFRPQIPEKLLPSPVIVIFSKGSCSAKVMTH